MPLEVRHNRSDHTHENVQFRRVAQSLIAFFKEQNWDGLLIGNPYAEDFSRFRADAILWYDHGLIIIDFKDYQGRIVMPLNDIEFRKSIWYNETASDQERIVIKGGHRFVNPFMQLNVYRTVMNELINTHNLLKYDIDSSRIGVVNLFSGPIVLNRESPRSIPYYKICQETDFVDFLYDFSSSNSFSAESAAAFKAIFPSEEWRIPLGKVLVRKENLPKPIVKVDADLEKALAHFMNQAGSGIFVLESMFEKERDNWASYLLQQTLEVEMPQTEIWIHSSRIQRKVKKRSGIISDSLYSMIYGGIAAAEDKNDAKQSPNEKEEDILQEIIPLKKDHWLEEKSLVILHEAHLVSRSLHQSELLRFGTGRLLEDLFQFLKLESKPRKLICIGDPYSLSYGKAEESGIAIASLRELYKGKIVHYKSLPKAASNSPGMKLRILLGNAIEKGAFNQLKYPFDSQRIIKVDKAKVLDKLRAWFAKPFERDPANAMLVYANKDAGKLNLWIKKNLLKNGPNLAPGDLLLLNNNLQISDDTGLGISTQLHNGMYLTVKECKEDKVFSITISQLKEPVDLRFKKIQVKCLSINNQPDAEIWILENYFKSEGSLSKYEQIALRVFVKQRIQALKEKTPFEESEEYDHFIYDHQAKKIAKEIKDLERKIKDGKGGNILLEQSVVAHQKIKKIYQKRYHQKALVQVSTEDPFVNAAQVVYGWTITVHKAVGSHFTDVCINTFQGEDRGVRNANYYRWLYSGLATCHRTVFVINPQEISPMENCQFEDLVGENWKEAQASKNHLMEFKNFEVPKKYKALFEDNVNANVQAITCLLADQLVEKGFVFKEGRRCNEYLTKIYFSKGNGWDFSLVLAINNKGNGKVSTIRKERGEALTNEELDALVQQIIESTVAKSEDTLADVLTDFRAPIYSDWKKKCSGNGAKLLLKNSHAYQDVFVMVQGEQKIKFQVIYNGKGFINKVNVIEKTDSIISLRLHKYLFNE